MANWTKRVFGNVLWVMVLTAVEVSGNAMQFQTCSLIPGPRLVVPAGMVIDEYCALRVTVIVKGNDKSKSLCILADKPTVSVYGLPIFGSILKYSRVAIDAAESKDVIISGCIIVNQSSTTNTFESVIDKQVKSLSIKFSMLNFMVGTCGWNGSCQSAVNVSIDRPPVISAEVSSQAEDEQVKSVTQTKLMSMCCGECDSNANQSDVSNVTVKVTASDDDWQWVEPTAETLKIQNEIKFRVVNSSGNLTDQQFNATQLTNLTWTVSSVAMNSAEVLRHVTRQSVCDWLKEAVKLTEVVTANVTFDVVIEMVVDESVQTGVDPKYLVKDSTSWSGLIQLACRNMDLEWEWESESESTDVAVNDKNVLLLVAIGAGLFIAMFPIASVCWKCLPRKRYNLSTNSNSCQNASGRDAVDENLAILNDS